MGWRWDDVELFQEILCQLMHCDLIYKADDREWRTDKELYDRLREEGWLDVLDDPDGGVDKHCSRRI